MKGVMSRYLICRVGLNGNSNLSEDQADLGFWTDIRGASHSLGSTV